MANRTLWRQFAVGTAAGGGALLFSLALIPAALAQQAGTPAAATSVSASAMRVAPGAPFTLKEAAQQAVLKNPEVMARWHSIRSAEGERDAARGGLLPRIDLNATAGPQRRSNFPDQYSTRWGQLELTQLLYDGFTRQEIDRLDHNVRAKVFEFFDISEATALEAARAYFDVLRYRELVRLAENNFVEHRAVFTQTDRRVQAKIARAVDLEQIQGRLALAEANLLIETANLHDTTARFQRIVGRAPSEVMDAPPLLSQQLPGDAARAIDDARVHHPALLASIENVRAATSALSSRDAAFRPRVDFRLRREQGNNQLGPVGQLNTTTAEMVLSWNLFNGFSDKARERQFAAQVNVARDVRDKTCRDLRQTLLIAFNDVQKLREQILYLQQHVAAVSKALVAYRQQFDIGQRSLLDLLDTENELFQARRAVVNAIQDQNLAYARAHQSVGTLLRALDLTSMDTGEVDLSQWRIDSDGAQECPSEPVTVYTVDKQALTARALEQAKPSQLAQALEGRPGATVPPAVVVQPARTMPATPANAESEVRSALEAWRAAWARKDTDGYLNAYAPAFRPTGTMSVEDWRAKRRGIIGRSSNVAVDLDDVTFTSIGPARATTAFTQTYRSASFRDRTRKTLVWERTSAGWRIASETTEPAAAK